MVDQIDVFAPSEYPRTQEPIAEIASNRTTLDTAFELENPVYNFIDWLGKPTFDADPTYTVDQFIEQRNKTPFFNEYREKFYGVRSKEEFDFVRSEIEEEIQQREFLAAQGWGGVVAAIGAGLLSPTMLIPAFGQVKGLNAIATGMGYGMLAGGLDEAMLQLNQETRGVGETALTVGAATVAGGLLGAGATYLRNNTLREIEADMAGSPGQVYIHGTAPAGVLGSVGAKATLSDPGPLKSALGMEVLLKNFGPVMRGFQQKISDVAGSTVHRNFVGQVGHGGLELDAAEQGLTATAGRGTIEDRATTYDVYDYRADNIFSENFMTYMETPEGAFRMTRSRLRAAGGKGSGKLNYDEFKREITKALFSGDEHEIPQVAAAARSIRSEILDPLIKAANEAGVLSEFGDLVGDESYFHRIWDAAKVSATPDLVERLARDFEAKLVEEYGARAQKLSARIDKLEELNREYQMTPEQAKALRALVKAERNKFKEKNIEFLRLDEEIRGLKAQRGALTQKINKLTQKGGDTKGLLVERDILDDQISALQSTEGYKAFKLKKGRYNAQINRYEKIRSGEVSAEKARYAAALERAFGRRADLAERARVAGSDDFDPTTGRGSFYGQAYADAEKTVEKLKHSGPRLPQFNAVQGDRGLEHARVLDVNSLDYLDVLETNPAVVVRRMIKTLGPDIEIAKRFGDKQATAYFDALEQEKLRKLANIKAKDWSDEKKAKAMQQLDKQYAEFVDDAVAMLDRLRHTRGLPDNPDSYLERAGRVAMGLNTMRFMGSVVPSSVADVGRIIFKHGFGKTFKYALAPMLRDWKTFKLSAMEAKYAGNALDALNHKRALALHDMFEDYHRHTTFERAVDIGASKIGLIAGFDFWTSAMKMADAAVVNGRIMDAIATLKGVEVDGKLPGKLTGKAKAAQKYLAENEIDGRLADAIWREMDGPEAGGGKVGDVWLPNTESWKNEETKMGYRAALNRQLDATITTPGIERPKFVDASTWARLIFQFKSFVMSSTTRTMVAGLQQRDAAAIQGVLTSLAMGALSYWIYTQSIGKPEEFQNASYGKIMDEAIDRSGLLGVLAMLQQATQRIPATAPYTSFAGERTTRRAGQDLLDLALGPSYNLAQNVGNLIVGLDEPTQSTLHKLRLLLPYQNVFYLRQLLDKVEASTADALDLPETRR
jgi:hypothetical protein